MEYGGDPVCWIDRVCPECGRFQDDRDAPACQDCGAPRDTGAAALPDPTRHSDSTVSHRAVKPLDNPSPAGPTTSG